MDQAHLTRLYYTTLKKETSISGLFIRLGDSIGTRQIWSWKSLLYFLKGAQNRR